MVGSQHPTGSRSPKFTDAAHALWDELLHPIDELSLSQWPQEGEPAWDLNCDEPDADGDIAAPTAAEIESLLSRLSSQSAAQSVAPAPPRRLLDSRSFLSLSLELQAAFLEDATRCIARLQSALLQLKAHDAHEPSLNQVRRELHTLKGASATVGLEDWAEYLHQLEDCLQDDGKRSQRTQFESLLAWIDQIQIDVETFQQQSQRLSLSASGAGDTTIPFAPCDRHAHSSADECADTKLNDDRDTVRLQTGQFDQLINTMSGLLATQPAIHELYQQLRSLRARPLSLLFQRLQEVVRSVSQSEGKDVQLERLGEGAAIERSLEQCLFEPLMHIVRNAVCHGIEEPAQRQTLGKPARGSIRMQFIAGSGLLTIDVADDGSGLDYDAIRRRGVELGLLAADAAVSVEQLNSLIFQPNFSTCSQISQSAGRGMGMSAVLAAVEELGGWLQVDSQPQRGTRIRLFVPLGPQVEHVVLFRCAHQLFALPASEVQSAGKIDESTAELDLNALLREIDTQPSLTRQSARLICQTPSTPPATVPTQRLALRVEQIIGCQQIVIHPFPALLKHHPCCAGVALLERGEIAFLISIQKLVESQAGLASMPPSTRTMRTTS